MGEEKEYILTKKEKKQEEERDRDIKVSIKMVEEGGHFAENLGKALQKADLNNVRRIKKAFPEYWEKYSDKKFKE